MSLLEKHDNVNITVYLKFLLLTVTHTLLGDEIRFLRKFEIIPETCIKCKKPVSYKRNLSCIECKMSGNEEIEMVKTIIETYLKNN